MNCYIMASAAYDNDEEKSIQTVSLNLHCHIKVIFTNIAASKCKTMCASYIFSAFL